MNRRTGPMMALLLMSGLLANCGGGGGVGSTPTPAPSPTPTPTPTYTPLANLTGNQTFQTGGLAWSLGGGSDGATTTRPFGNGVTLSYVAATDSYTLTSPEGFTVAIDSSNISPNQTTASQTAYDKTVGTTRDLIFLIKPMVKGVALNYVLFGSWNRMDTTNATSRVNLAVGGVPTIASDMPKSGTADYDLGVGGTVIVSSSNTPYSLAAGGSTGTMSVDFSAGTLTTSMTMRGQQLVGGGGTIDLGTASATGTLTSGGPGFTGTFSGGGFTGDLSGAFFGPQASEAAYVWAISGNGLSGRGVNAALKK